VVLSRCGTREIENIAERLRQAVNDKKIKTEVGPVGVTISLGGVSTSLDPDIKSKKLIQICDKALYKAKNQGRNRAVIIKSLSEVEGE
jgi:diguanylate cyclase (GGDEF)-like protein